MTKAKMILGSALAALVACGGTEEAPEGRNMTTEEVAAELSAVQLEPGLWEQNVEILDVSAPNLPVEVQQMMKAQGTQTTRNCITPEQAARPDANFLAAQEDSSCTYQDFSMRGGRLQGTMTCTGSAEMPGRMVARMDGEYGPQSYDMRMDMTTSVPEAGAEMTIETRTTGRRVGDCPAEGAAE